MTEDVRKTIAIRADGNHILGMGHLMRCLSIARELRKYADCVFLVAEEAAGHFLREKGVHCEVLETDYRNMNAELAMLDELYDSYHFSLLLVDSYQCTQEYLDAWMKYCPVYRMDDVGENELFSTGLINYNVYAKELDYSCITGKKMQLLLGAEYAPVREEFLQTPYEVKAAVSRILITMGGSDALNIAGKLCEILLRKTEIQAELVVVCGRFNAHLAELKQLQTENSRVKIMVDVPDMWDKMAQADIAISAAGSTMYELSAMGVPTISCYYVENQRQIAEGFAKEAGVLNAGNYVGNEGIVLKNIVEETIALIHSYGKRVELSNKMKRLTDGRGAARITEYILKRI